MVDDAGMGGVRPAWAAVALVALEVRVALAGHEYGIDTPEYLAASKDLTAGRYPPGYPTLLAAVDAVGLPAWSVTVVAGMVLAGLIWWAAWLMAGPTAAAVAAVFCLLSELVAEGGVLMMSDTPAAALVIGALVSGIHGRWRLAGVLVALSAWVRLPHALFAVAAPRWSMVRTAGIGIGMLVLFNLAVFGSVSSYQDDHIAWSVGYFTDALYWDNMDTPYGNWYFYLSALGGQWGQLLPLLPIAAGIEMWRRRFDPVTRLALGIVAVNLGMYLFYFYQSTRFVLPAASVLVVYAAAWTAGMVTARLEGAEADVADRWAKPGVRDGRDQ